MEKFVSPSGPVRWRVRESSDPSNGLDIIAQTAYQAWYKSHLISVDTGVSLAFHQVDCHQIEENVSNGNNSNQDSRSTRSGSVQVPKRKVRSKPTRTGLRSKRSKNQSSVA